MSRSRQIRRQAERSTQAPPGQLISRSDLATTARLYKHAAIEANERAHRFEALFTLSALLNEADRTTYGSILIARVSPKAKIAHHLKTEGLRQHLADVMEIVDAQQRADPDQPIWPRELFDGMMAMHDQFRTAIIAGENGDEGEALRALSHEYYRFGDLLEETRGRPRAEPRAYVLGRLAQMRDAAGDDDPRYVNWLKEIRNTIHSRPASELRFAEKDAVREWIDEQIAKRQDLNRYLINAVSSYCTRERQRVSVEK